jgi:hypothetical protein
LIADPRRHEAAERLHRASQQIIATGFELIFMNYSSVLLLCLNMQLP